MSLYQNLLKQSNTATTVEMHASENPGLDEGFTDPTLFCTAFKKNRFYLFSKRQPKETSSGAPFNHMVTTLKLTPKLMVSHFTEVQFRIPNLIFIRLLS